ncbi:histidine kinase [Actinoplanes sp. NPDC051851]|uniref:sensor histidine kinase n=1 Tax=Actinoplanes sp. NPDC051851 TaxID=3154753 RepID=UPI00341A8E94
MTRTILLRLAQLGALGVLAILGVFDVAQGMHAGVVLWQIGSAVAVAAVWLPDHRTGSSRLPPAAIAVAANSIALTAYLSVVVGAQVMWGLAESLAMLGVLYVVARHAPVNRAIVACGLALVAVGLQPLRGGVIAIYVIFGLIQALAGAAAIATGVYLRTAEEARRRAVDHVRAEQRAEFARDLHDFIAHHVTGIVVQAQGARFIAEQDPRRVLLALEQIENAGAETMASMRRMVGVLRDPESRPDAPLAPIAGVHDLGPLVGQFTAAGGAAARLHADGSLDGLPVEVSTSAYRVVMEALTNVRQHAPEATVVDVWFRRTPETLLLRVANDGPPPRAGLGPERSGYGLVGLAERVRAAGGQFTSGPGISTGWVVDAVFPLDRSTP